MKFFHIVLLTQQRKLKDGTVQGDYITSSKQPTGSHSRKFNSIISYKWGRVILDEAHCIKNPVTAVSKACCALRADKRWAVTGTPIQNSLQDIYGLLKFLKHEPWCEAAFWKATISDVVIEAQNQVNRKPKGKVSENEEVQSANSECGLKVALGRVKRVISPLILRRTKQTLDQEG